jgi:hypothetical protein
VKPNIEGRPEVRTGVTGPAEEVASRFIEEEARAIDMPPERLPLEVLDDGDAGVCRARAEVPLVLDRCEPSAEVGGGGQHGRFWLCDEAGGRLFGDSGCLLQDRPYLLVLRCVVAKVGQVRQPPHAEDGLLRLEEEGVTSDAHVADHTVLFRKNCVHHRALQFV